MRNVIREHQKSASTNLNNFSLPFAEIFRNLFWNRQFFRKIVKALKCKNKKICKNDSFPEKKIRVRVTAFFGEYIIERLYFRSIFHRNSELPRIGAHGCHFRVRWWRLHLHFRSSAVWIGDFIPADAINLCQAA